MFVELFLGLLGISIAFHTQGLSFKKTPPFSRQTLENGPGDCEPRLLATDKTILISTTHRNPVIFSDDDWGVQSPHQHSL